MAEITKSVLGQISGQLGDLVFRRMNGNRFVSVRPSKYKASRSASAKDGRSNFAITVAFSKSVNYVSVLKEIWSASDAEGTNSFQKLIKANAKLVKQGSLTTLNIITPSGLTLKLQSASFENKKLHLSIICPSSQFLKFPAVLFVYLYFEKESRSVVPVSSSLEKTSPDGLYDIDLILDSRVTKMISNDPNPIMYIALAGGEHYKKKLYWTSTASVHL